MRDVAGEWQAKAREQFEDLLAGIGRSVSETARAEASETWNQRLRRLRGAVTAEAVATLTLELSSPFASRGAFFLFREQAAEAFAARGLGEVPFQFEPNDAAAFQAAIESRDPVIAVGIPSEVSPVLAERLRTETVERVYLFPVTVRGEVRALLFAAGTVQPSPLELLAGMAGTQWETFTPPPVVKRADLIGIGGAQPPATGQKAWADLSAELQALHLRAQRQARLKVAEIRLEHGEALRRGVSQAGIYDVLREPIDRAREEFRRDFTSATPTMVDYLYLELVHTLAHDNDQLLGTNFPGPLV